MGLINLDTSTSIPYHKMYRGEPLTKMQKRGEWSLRVASAVRIATGLVTVT